MTADPRWTAETVALIADYLDDYPHATWASSGREAADAILTRLADAGLLLPPDIEANRQYGRLMPNGLVLQTSLPDPTHYRLNGPWRLIEVADG